MAQPIHGVVVDSLSGAPVPGAIVELQAKSPIQLPTGHPAYAILQEDWTVADEAGRFVVGGGFNFLLFPRLGWRTSLHATSLAQFPGQIEVHDSHALAWPMLDVPPVTIELRPIRYRSELERLRQDGSAMLMTSGASAYAEEQQRRTAIHVVPRMTPGVFMKVPGASFDRVDVGGAGVFAQDAASRQTFAWTLLGDPRWSGGGSRAEFDAQREHRARLNHIPTALVCKVADGSVVVPVLLETVSCAGNSYQSYHVTRDGRLHRFVGDPRTRSMREDPAFADTVARTIAGPQPKFIDIAVAPNELYAVALDDAVYRFSSTGVADQAIAVSANPRLQRTALRAAAEPPGR